MHALRIIWKRKCAKCSVAQLLLSSNVHRYTVSQNLSPEWSVPWCDTKELLVYDEEQLIRFCVFDKDQFSADDPIGCVKPVPVRKVLEQLRINKSGSQSLGSRWRHQMTFRLTSSFSSNCEVKDSGSLTVEFLWNPIVASNPISEPPRTPHGQASSGSAYGCVRI